MSLLTKNRPNKALQPTANPLRGLPAAELGRYASLKACSTTWPVALLDEEGHIERDD